MSQSLFSTIDELKEHIPVAYTTLGIGDERPFILLAQETYLKDILGSQLYDQLLDHVDPSGDSGSGSGSGSGGNYVADPWLERLLEKVRPAVAMLAYYEGLPFIEVKISKQGIHQVSDEELAPIFSTQRQRLEAALLKLGHNQLEQVLLWLERKQTHFPVWKNSDAYSTFKGSVIESAKMFTEYWSELNNRRLTYMAIRPLIKEVERSELKNLLGSALYYKVMEALESGDASEYDEILEFARPLVAYRAAADGLPNLSLSIEAYGVFTQSIQKNERNVHAFDAASSASMKQAAANLNAKADSYHVQLKDHLNANLDLYPDFETSSAYDSDNTSTKGSVDDQEDSGIVMF